MRLMTISAAVSVLLALTFAPAYAGQGNSGNHGPKTTTHGPTTTSTTHGPSTTTHGPSATGASAKPVKGPSTKPTTTTTASSGTSSTSTTGTTTTTPAIDFTSGAVGSKLTKNTALRTKVQSRLTALGYTGTVYQAAYGFKNLGQFVAATNVSKNLGISFDKLKLQMTGLSVKADGTVLKANVGTDGKVTLVDPALVTNAAPTKSLGQSIQTVKSSVNATAAAQTATTQANAEIAGTTTVGK
jgi:hypothetical protein